ncbi:VWA domain-containing protein [Candidatus Woesearchaeota archaeon]|nr:VWA domain-containing protein [Candidatus Woesearchaeota archaeon]
MNDNSYGEGVGQLVLDSIDNCVGQFVPDILFEQLVKEYSNARRILGPRLIRLLTGFEMDDIERNARYPEFARTLKDNLLKNVERLRNAEIIDEHGVLTEKAVECAGVELLKSAEQEVFGEPSKRISRQGEEKDLRKYRSGDYYKDVNIPATIREVTRNNAQLDYSSLIVNNKVLSKGCQIIFALDASISMRGEKISVGKKAGASLALRAMNNKDRVGVVVFGTDIKESIAPSLVLKDVLHALVRARPSTQTDIARTILYSSSLFSFSGKKHLVIITDAFPTIGAEDDVIEEVSKAGKLGITITVIGIDVDAHGRMLAEKMALLGNGKFYIAESISDIPTLVLQDYGLL